MLCYSYPVLILQISIMDTTNEDAVSDPLKHLLLLELKSSIKKSKAKDYQEQPRKTKRVRFSDEVNQLSYDVPDEKDPDILLESCDGDNNVAMTIGLSAFLDQKETYIFNEGTKLKTCASSLHNFENSIDSDKNSEVYFDILNTGTEISSDVIQATGDFCNENSINTTDFMLLDSCENELKDVSGELEKEAYGLNEVTNQVENLVLESTLLEKSDSISFVKTSQHCSDDIPISIGDSVAVSERQTDDTDFSSISLKKRCSSGNQKQSFKLNSALTKKSTYSSATELNLAVFKAWCEVKDNAKDIKSVPLNKIKASDVQTTSNNAYSVWKKSKIEAFKKAKQVKQSAIFSHRHEETSDDKKEEVELAFKAWKKKKDELLKQQRADTQNKKQELSLMNDREKKMEADAAFSAWKEHKSHITIMDKKRRAWVIRRQKEEENQKILRDKEALNMYNMWLENKNSLAKRDVSNPVQTKPPWSPPGKSH
ncbi:uncharacterized protein NPIL_399221 [Nephila pilipes]|uniref:Microtubule-associated protein 9 n=1 Tax=Nephila pilipes TaxID=299642 RepID=A0A8X6MAF0_NEPPI|nr:uncharacterized protein NPIL_399221 [Nephila pilipes]